MDSKNYETWAVASLEYLYTVQIFGSPSTIWEITVLPLLIDLNGLLTCKILAT